MKKTKLSDFAMEKVDQQPYFGKQVSMNLGCPEWQKRENDAFYFLNPKQKLMDDIMNHLNPFIKEMEKNENNDNDEKTSINIKNSE